MTEQPGVDVQFGRQFVLVRDSAVIADGIEFPDGHVAIHWTGAKWPTLTPHQTMDAAIAAHSQNGAVRVVWQLTGIPQAEYGSVWPELVGWVQQAQEDGEQIDPAQLLEYMQELKQRAIAPVRQWMAGIRDAARQAAGQPAAECPQCGDTGACNGGPCAHPAAGLAADEETAQCWRAEPHPPHTWTRSPEVGGADCPGLRLGTRTILVADTPAAGLAAPTNLDTETCSHCKGTGADPEDEGDYEPAVHMHNPTTIGPCPECHGSGKVTVRTTTDGAPLTDNDRAFLTFALDQAADVMASCDGFTDADDASLARLRRLAAEAES